MCKTKEVKQILFLIIQPWFIFDSGPKFCARNEKYYLRAYGIKTKKVLWKISRKEIRRRVKLEIYFK